MKTPLVECYALHTKFLTGSGDQVDNMKVSKQPVELSRPKISLFSVDGLQQTRGGQSVCRNASSKSAIHVIL